MVGYISSMFLILVVGSLVTFLTKSREQARMSALLTSLIVLIMSILMFFEYRTSGGLETFTELYDWVPSIGIGYHVAVDGLSLPMVLLTTITSFLCTVYAWGEKVRSNQFFAFILFIELALIGVFVSLDFFMFFIFWEFVLLPMFFLIGIWGGPRKDYAAIKFLIYTHVSSGFILLGIFAIYYFNIMAGNAPTFDIPTLLSAYPTLELTSFWKNFIFAAFLFGFLVKMPAVPFHTWLPDAHVEAPTVGSILLAGVLLKMGGYGLFRFLIPMMPNTSVNFVYIIAIFGLISILYAPIAAFMQPDIKKLIAFSSIGHMGFISLGVAASIAAGGETSRIFAASGAMFQLFAHGIVTAVLFGSAGVIDHHAGTRIIANLGGLAKRMPKFAVLMIIGFLASIGFPGTIAFIAEFSILAGSYPQLPLFVVLALPCIPITVMYHLYAFQRAMLGPYNQSLGEIGDATHYELLALAVWVVIIFALGLHPAPIYDMMESASTNLIMALPPGGIG
ncbi:MAG: NADH-quinone oxidoreductase subunit M [Euryarchaeota archaeon]|nr:NADH-quinone oxidoreductase subunit M [Euryarchaeota archaeon]